MNKINTGEGPFLTHLRTLIQKLDEDLVAENKQAQEVFKQRLRFFKINYRKGLFNTATIEFIERQVPLTDFELEQLWEVVKTMGIDIKILSKLSIK